MKILVVDDDKSSQIVLSRILQQVDPGHDVTTAADGEEALLILQNPRQIFDVLFLDIEMPKVNGIQVLKTLHEKKPLFDRLKVIVCSSIGIKELKECLEFGAKHFIAKPPERKTVEKKLRMALAKP
jgi:CheY-like chemotaxis protein